MNDYINKNNQEIEQFHNIIKEVVKHLDGAAIEPLKKDDRGAYTQGRPLGYINFGKMQIYADRPWNKTNRAEFSLVLSYRTPEGWVKLWDYMNYEQRQASKPEIGVSLSRTPEAIAKDITRRLLPDAIQLYNDLMIAYKDHVTECNQAHAIYTEFCTLLGKEATQEPRDQNGEPRYTYTVDMYTLNSGGYHGDVTIKKNDVNFDIKYMPLDKARKLAKLLGDL